VAKAIRIWIAALGEQTACLERGSLWENGYCARANDKRRDERRNGEIFYSIKEAQAIVETWRRRYKTIRPGSALGYVPPVPEIVPGPPSLWLGALSLPG